MGKFTAEDLEKLSRKELQDLAKQHDIRANRKSADIIKALLSKVAKDVEAASPKANVLAQTPGSPNAAVGETAKLTKSPVQSPSKLTSAHNPSKLASAQSPPKSASSKSPSKETQAGANESSGTSPSRTKSQGPATFIHGQHIPHHKRSWPPVPKFPPILTDPDGPLVQKEFIHGQHIPKDKRSYRPVPHFPPNLKITPESLILTEEQKKPFKFPPRQYAAELISTVERRSPPPALPKLPQSLQQVHNELKRKATTSPEQGPSKVPRNQKSVPQEVLNEMMEMVANRSPERALAAIPPQKPGPLLNQLHTELKKKHPPSEDEKQ